LFVDSCLIVFGERLKSASIQMHLDFDVFPLVRKLFQVAVLRSGGSKSSGESLLTRWVPQSPSEHTRKSSQIIQNIPAVGLVMVDAIGHPLLPSG
jgi:hypothetical protein